METTSARHIIHDRFFFWCCIAIAFLMPVYGRLLPPVIILMVLNWMVDGRFLKKFQGFFTGPERWRTLAFSAIYILYFLGMLNTSNLDSGWFDLEVKLSLLIFPLIFSTTDISGLTITRTRSVLYAFVAGCMTGSLILLVHSFMEKIHGVPGTFVYSSLSWSFHPSYYAMYLTFAITIIADFLFIQTNELSKVKKAGLLALILFFFTIIFLLSSKAGIGCLLLVTIYYILILIFRKRIFKLSIILIITSVVCFYSAFSFFPYAVERISKISQANLPSEKNGSTFERIMVWKTSVKIIKQHFLTGVGTGDVKDELLKSYKKEDLQLIFFQKLNAHNQYLQIFIALGICGLIVLLASLVIPAISAFRSDAFLYFIFIVIVGVNLVVESMLEVQAGVVFYAFFNVLLFQMLRNTRFRSQPVIE